MASPPNYTPVHTFVSDSATLANFPGQQLDVEFNDVKATTDAIIANLNLLQRGDGAPANGIITFDSLSASIQSNGLGPASAWVTGTAYQIGNAAVTSNTLYRCLVAHTSGVFATDLAAGKWVLVSTLLYSAGTNITFAGSVISVSTSPVFTTPSLGVATATSINGNVFTSGPYTLTGAAGKTFTFSNTLTLAGTDGTTITFQGSDTYVGRATADTFTNKTFDTAGAGNSLSINGVAVTANTGTGAVARAAGPTFTTPALGVATATSLNGNTFTTGTYTLTGAGGKTLTFNNTITIAGIDATTLTFQGTDTYVGRATTDTLTNKTFDTAGSGNVFKINGTAISANVGTGANVLATNPAITGTATNDNAAAGVIGEYIESVIASGAATALTTAAPKTITSISLTAGDWDVSGNVGFVGASSASVTQVQASISLATNAVDLTIGRSSQQFFATNTITNGVAYQIPVGPVRLSLATTTTVFLIGQSTFTVGTESGFGIIRARRMR